MSAATPMVPVTGPVLPISQPPPRQNPRLNRGNNAKVETFRQGYPRFTALISSYSPYLTLRRFSRLRARLLLLQQDKLSILEQELDQIDEVETSPLYLGCSRLDKNGARLQVLSNIRAALTEYDDLVERTSKFLHFGPPEDRDTDSLENWLNGNGCLARDEASYLKHKTDLVSLSASPDSAVTRIEAWIEDTLHQLLPNFRNHTMFDEMSSDRHVFLYSSSRFRRISKALVICLVTTLLLVPIVVCNILTTSASRIVVVMFATMTYLLVLSGLTRAKTTELVIAGTTYATVLTVFVSGASNTNKHA